MPAQLSDRTKRHDKQKRGEARAEAAGLYLEEMKAAIWYALLGQTDAAANRAAKIATAGRMRSDRADDEELQRIAKAAQSDSYEEARAGTNAYNARLCKFAIMLWLIAAIENSGSVQPGQIPHGLRQLLQVQLGFGGTLAGYREVTFDVASLMGGMAGIDLETLAKELYGARGEE